MGRGGSARRTGNEEGDMTEVARAMREIAAAVAAQAAVQAQQAAAQAAAQEQQAAVQQTDRTTLTDFKKHNPPEFHGDLDPEKAEHWVQELEEIFTAMECSDERRVTHSAFQLKGDSKIWWKVTQQMLEGRGEMITWGVFKQYFLEKYFLVSARQAKEEEFTRLYQGSMTVHEYAVRFESLAKYSKYLLVTADEDWKCRKFEGGLRFEIKRVVIPFGIQSFAYLVEKCKIIEDLDRVQKARTMNRGNMGKGGPVHAQEEKAMQQKPYSRPPQQGPYVGGSGASYRPLQQQPQLPVRCWKCGGPHLHRDCTQTRPTYFNCGKMGHLARECRAPPSGGQGSGAMVQRPMIGGRVFTLSGTEASQSEDLVQEEGQIE